VEFTLILALFAVAVQLLFDSLNYPMAIFISQIFSTGLPVLAETL
jgi:hypothetical protein